MSTGNYFAMVTFSISFAFVGNLLHILNMIIGRMMNILLIGQYNELN